MQTLSAYSAIANGGTTLGAEARARRQSPELRSPVASERARSAVRALSGRCSKASSTSASGETARIPGYRLVAGKTGTAAQGRPDDPQVLGDGLHLRVSSSVISPASAPLWTVLVVINEPKGAYYGALTAAPIFSQIGKRLLVLEGVAPDQPTDSALATARLLAP